MNLISNQIKFLYEYNFVDCRHDLKWFNVWFDVWFAPCRHTLSKWNCLWQSTKNIIKDVQGRQKNIDIGIEDLV